MSTSRSVSAYLILCLALWGLTPAAPVDGAPRAGLGDRIGCYSCLLVDDNGKVLWERRPDARLANASTTKMVTALVVVDRTDLDGIVTVSKGAAATGGGGPQLRPGQHLPVRALLSALLVASSNDAAAALAEHVAGSQARFVDFMNRRAAGLDAEDTHFVNVHGLDASGHYSSARDLATIALELLNEPELAPLVALRAIRMPTASGVERFENTNLLLETYPGTVGVKTGYTIAAGNVLVAAVERHGRRLVSVVMGSEDSFADSRLLQNLGWNRLGRKVLVEEGTPVASLVFDPAGSVTVVTGSLFRGAEDPRGLRLEFAAEPGAVAPDASGRRVGTIYVLDREEVIGQMPAVTAASLPHPGPSGLVDVLSGLLKAGSYLIPVAP